MRFRIGFVMGAVAGFYAGAKAGQKGLDRVTGTASKVTGLASKVVEGRKGGSAAGGNRQRLQVAGPVSSGVIADLAAAGGAESSLAAEVGHSRPS